MLRKTSHPIIKEGDRGVKKSKCAWIFLSSAGLDDQMQAPWSHSWACSYV